MMKEFPNPSALRREWSAEFIPLQLEDFLWRSTSSERSRANELPRRSGLKSALRCFSNFVIEKFFPHGRFDLRHFTP